MGGTYSAVTAKLEWAKHDVLEIKRALKRFQDEEGDCFVVTPERPVTGKNRWRVTWKASGLELPEQELAFKVTDAVHNLRATLDYLVYELAIRRRGGHEPLRLKRGDPLLRAAFPIYTSDTDYYRKVRDESDDRSPLGCLTKKQRAAIERLQPFGEPNDTLALLGALDNLGKHRRSHVFVRQERIWLDEHDARRFMFKKGESVSTSKRPKDGARIALLTQPKDFTSDLPIEAQVNVALKRRLSLVFEPGGPAGGEDVYTLLTLMTGRVTNITRKFKSDFKGR